MRRRSGWPKSIASLEDRLRTRFEWGLITDVQPPEFETRLAILQKKAEAEHLGGIPPEVLAFIATNISDNIRELEGALIRVAAYSSLNRAQLSEEIKLGRELKVALGNMAYRVEAGDLPFFVTAITIQRESTFAITDIDLSPTP